MAGVMTNFTCLTLINERLTCPKCSTTIGFFYKLNLGVFPSYCKNCGVHLYIKPRFILAEVLIFLIASGIAIFLVSNQIVSIILVIFGLIVSIMIRLFVPLCNIEKNQKGPTQR